MKHGESKLARWQMPLLFLLSLGILACLMGMHPPQIRILFAPPMQGSGRGAGGVATLPQQSTAPAASYCLPTDISCIITNVSSSIASGVQSVFQPISDAILTNPANILSQTPVLTGTNETADNAIINVNRFFVKVVDIAFASLLLIAGYNVMVGRHLLLPFSTIMEILPRAVIVMGAVQFNLWFVRLFLQLENALALDATHVAGINMLTNLIAGLFKSQPASLLTLILLVVLAFMTCLLLIQNIARIAIVALACALTPLGLCCFFLPQTVRWGRLWLVTLSTSVMVQLLQVVALGLGGVFISALANTFGMGKDLATLFLAIGTMGLVLKIPGMLQTWALNPMMSPSASGGEAGSDGVTASPTPSSTGFSGSGVSGGTTTVTEEGAIEGMMVEDAGGALLLMF